MFCSFSVNIDIHLISFNLFLEKFILSIPFVIAALHQHTAKPKVNVTNEEKECNNKDGTQHDDHKLNLMQENCFCIYSSIKIYVLCLLK